MREWRTRARPASESATKTRRERGGIEGLHSVEKGIEGRDCSGGGHQAESQTEGDHGLHAPRENHGANLRGAGAEDEADADLALSLADEDADRAIEANHGESERAKREPREQPRGETSRAHRRRDDLFIRLHRGDRLARVELAKSRRNGPSEGARIARRTNHAG